MATGVIPNAARNAVRAAFARDRVDAITIYRGLPGDYDPATQQTPAMPTPSTVFSGDARISKVSPSGTVELGEGEIPQRTCTAQIAYDAPLVQINDVVQITAAIDPQLVGTSWRVTGVDGGGSWAAERRLALAGWYPATGTWTGA